MASNRHLTHPVTDTKPWYRQFWPWFIIALPASAVIAGLTTVYIAFEEPDGLVIDDYYKEGLAINRTLARDERAAELGLWALVTPGEAGGEFTIDLHRDTAPEAQETLILTLQHPTRAHMDVTVPLVDRGAGTFHARVPPLAQGYWYIRIEPNNKEWRLLGRIHIPNGTKVELRPPGQPNSLPNPRG